MQRLTGLDATFLYQETGSVHMHVASLAVFDPNDAPQPYSFDAVKQLVADRLHLIPPFRRRLVFLPFELTHPLWIEDPDFDLDFHVRRAALPAPGGKAELAEFAADVMGRQLDRSRPLWEMYIIEGLEGGLTAALTKTHHAAIDGVSGMELTAALLDLTPEPQETPPPAEPWQPDRVPTDLELVGWGLASLTQRPARAVKALRRTTTMALTLARRNRRPDVMPPPAPFSAPSTPFNVPLTPHRRIALAELPLDDVKQVKQSLGGTVNDVVLAVCAGALRRYLDDRGCLPSLPTVAMVPVSVRADDEAGALGNRVSAMLVRLPTDVDDPAEQLERVRAEAGAAKGQEQEASADALTEWTEALPPVLTTLAGRLAARVATSSRGRPLFNATISNVPGPPIPLYFAGAKMVSLYPLGPVADGVALNITLISYLDTVYVGIQAGREAVPDLDRLAAAIPDALGQLQKLASA